MERKKQFTILLSATDTLSCELHTKDGTLINFALEYSTEIDGVRHKILCVDTHHGFAHIHIFQTDRNIPITNDIRQYSNTYNQYKKYIENNFEELKNKYL